MMNQDNFTILRLGLSRAVLRNDQAITRRSKLKPAGFKPRAGPNGPGDAEK
jgi:hypothetical protein